MATAFFTGAPLTATGKPGDVDTAARNTLGAIAYGYDTSGNYAEYVYLTGVVSTIVGTVVTYGPTNLTALVVAGGIGLVAVATGLTVASTFGWYGIVGVFLTDIVANSAAGARLGRETTDGKVGDGFAGGDQIVGLYQGLTATTAAAVVLAQYRYPVAGTNVA